MFHHAARRQGCLMATLPTLEQAASAVANDIVSALRATWAVETSRPTRTLDSLGTLRLGPKAAQEFRDGHASLELDALVGHDVLRVVEHSDYGVTSSNTELAEAGF
jgi:hypothetical protein